MGLTHKQKILLAFFTPIVLFFAIVLLFNIGTKNEAAQNEPSTAAQNVPTVLGVFTDLRGPLQNNDNTENFQQTGTPDYSNIRAKSFLVYDLATGQILAQKEADKVLPIASLTKLLTAYVVYENLDLNSPITISSNDTLNVQPSLNLQTGDKILALDLFNAMLIGSGNDAALALANHTTETKKENFLDLMNSYAESLGMASSKFSNPLGFDSKDNYSTANDIKIIVTKTQNLSSFVSLGKKKLYEFASSSGNTYQIKATNALISKYQDLEAIKTGYTELALGSMITKLNFLGQKIVIIVLDSADRENDTLNLRKAVIDNFKLK